MFEQRIVGFTLQPQRGIYVRGRANRFIFVVDSVDIAFVLL